jgi:hypothetical protein
MQADLYREELELARIESAPGCSTGMFTGEDGLGQGDYSFTTVPNFGIDQSFGLESLWRVSFILCLLLVGLIWQIQCGVNDVSYLVFGSAQRGHDIGKSQLNPHLIKVNYLTIFICTLTPICDQVVLPNAPSSLGALWIRSIIILLEIRLHRPHTAQGQAQNPILSPPVSFRLGPIWAMAPCETCSSRLL